MTRLGSQACVAPWFRSDGTTCQRFARRGETEFLVLSLWTSVTDHERYCTHRFLNLRERSRAADDLDTITGDLIELDPAWTVTARG